VALGSKAVVGWGLVVVAALWLFTHGDNDKSRLPESKPSANAQKVEVSTASRPSSEEASNPKATHPAPPPPSSTPDREPASTPAETVFVSGNRVALRGGPGTDHPVIDRYDKGRPVSLLEERAKWSRVRDKLTAREGWIANFLLEDARSSKKARVASTQPKQERAPAAGLSSAEIAKRIISQSIASYPGSCPCPYNVDRGGRRCGKRSAYSRPGGYAPICYPSDVTSQMITAFTERR